MKQKFLKYKKHRQIRNSFVDELDLKEDVIYVYIYNIIKLMKITK